jgi:S1-C subfamily serine protease
VLVLEIPADSSLVKAGLQKNDVILSVNGAKTDDVATLLRQAPSLAAGQTIKVVISRDQEGIVLTIAP